MPEYISPGGIGECPKCGNNRFSGPDVVQRDARITCVNCGAVCTVDDAVRAGSRKPGGSLALVLQDLAQSDHGPFLALLEQKYRRSGDLVMLRELKAYREKYL
jgi:hypothetical protein